MNRLPQSTDMTLEQFAATFAKPPTIRTVQRWSNRQGRKKLRIFRPGKTPFVTAAEAARFRSVCEL